MPLLWHFILIFPRVKLDKGTDLTENFCFGDVIFSQINAWIYSTRTVVSKPRPWKFAAYAKKLSPVPATSSGKTASSRTILLQGIKVPLYFELWLYLKEPNQVVSATPLT